MFIFWTGYTYVSSRTLSRNCGQPQMSLKENKSKFDFFNNMCSDYKYNRILLLLGLPHTKSDDWIISFLKCELHCLSKCVIMLAGSFVYWVRDNMWLETLDK